MLVSFPFTFNITVPGLTNPFATSPPEQEVPVQAEPEQTSSDRPFRNRTGLQKISRRRPSPQSLLTPTAPISRKRGWEPSFAEPSLSTTTLSSTTGYLDTPAKYREMAGSSNNHEYHEVTMNDSAEEMPPPAKRRRGLAGQIVSTAVSAALIGTAVGLTVYRLWRDRGKEPEQIMPPPPAYEQGSWTPPVEQQQQQPPPIKVAPPTPRARKTRHQISSSKRPVAVRRPRVRPQTYTPPRNTSPALFPPSQPEFNFGHEEDEPADDQMDWIGDKLSMLIEEGKRALNREVVVMSDTKEDEVDDGSGAWEEEDDSTTTGLPSTSISRSSSIVRSKRPRNIGLPPPSYSYGSPQMSASPRRSGFDHPSSSSSAPQIITPHRSHSRGISSESAVLPSSFKEDEAAWESPELRESMERARARFLQNRGS